MHYEPRLPDYLSERDNEQALLCACSKKEKNIIQSEPDVRIFTFFLQFFLFNAQTQGIRRRRTLEIFLSMMEKTNCDREKKVAFKA